MEGAVVGLLLLYIVPDSDVMFGVQGHSRQQSLQQQVMTGRSGFGRVHRHNAPFPWGGRADADNK